MNSRRNWLKTLTLGGTAGLLLSPRDILSMMPETAPSLLGFSAPQTKIRLSSNENPYSPSPLMKQTIQNMDPELCRYPNRNFGQLETLIAEREGVRPEEVVITSGSREGLKAVGMMYSLKGGEIITCLPTYKALLTYAEFIGADIRAIPLTQRLGYNLEGIEAGINNRTKMIFVCNPNNPTGTLLDPDVLKSFCLRNSTRAPIFVDEVYYDYIEEKGYPSMKSLIKDGHDIIIARTFSKIYGLAGARIGYLMAKESIASRIRKSLMSGTNVLGLQLGMTALNDHEFYAYSLRQNAAAKKIIYKALTQAGLSYIPSHANFVFFKTGQDIVTIQKKYDEQGITVGRAFPPYMDWCRISTGTIEEVELFAKATQKVFSS